MTLMESAQICLYEKRKIGTWSDFGKGCHKVGGKSYIARRAEHMNLALELLKMNGQLEEESTDYERRYFTGKVIRGCLLHTIKFGHAKSMSSNKHHFSSDHNETELYSSLPFAKE